MVAGVCSSTIGAGDTFIAGMLYSLLVEQQQQQQQQASSQEKDSKHSRCDGTEGRGDDHVDGDVDAGEDSRQQRQRSLCNNLASSLKFAVELATKKVQQEGFAGLLLLSS
jgi:sugar/nucleoside kinase (ribokinase family)